MTDKLPPLKPIDHPEPRIMQWSKLEMEFIQAYAMKAVREAVAAYKAELFLKYEANTERATEEEGDAFAHGYLCGEREAVAGPDGWEANAQYLLGKCPYTVWQRPGAGPLDLLSTLVVTFSGTQMRPQGHPMFADENKREAVAAAIPEIDQRCKPSILGRIPPIQLTGYDLKFALEMIAPDDTAEQLAQSVCIQWKDDGKDLDGEHAPAGWYCWDAEYPEEGSIRLSATPEVKP